MSKNDSKSYQSLRSSEGRGQLPACIFVGAFGGRLRGGVTGGQVKACMALLESPLGNRIRWSKIDSTQESIPPPGLLRRAWTAAIRMVKFVVLSLKPGNRRALIFTADGLSFLEKGVMVLWAKVVRLRVVLCPRSGIIIDDLVRGGWRKRFIARVLESCDAVVCQSTYWKEYFQAHSRISPERLLVIPNWIALPEPVAKNYQSDQRTNVLFLGWIDRNKGVFDILEAINSSSALRANAKFHLCGGGPELENATTFVREKGLSDCVELCGWVSGGEKAALLRQAEMLVIASYREGFPNALLEGMAAGLAVVATRVGAIPNVLEQERTGLLIEPGDQSALATELTRLVTDSELRSRLGLNAQSHVYELHDVHRIWPTLEQAILGNETALNEKQGVDDRASVQVRGE